MTNGHIVLVTTQPLEGGEPRRTAYFVAEADAAKAEDIIAQIMAPNEKVQALAVLEEPAIRAMGLKEGEFRRAQSPARELDDELTEALKCTFPASDPVALESTLIPGRSREKR